jgi:hypothetical protein
MVNLLNKWMFSLRLDDIICHGYNPQQQIADNSNKRKLSFIPIGDDSPKYTWELLWIGVGHFLDTNETHPEHPEQDEQW